MTITINGTTGIAGVDGSASTPSYQGNDTNTGIFFPAADTIAFGEGGAESMRINSSGYVGIGTTSPGSPLSVLSSVSTAQGIYRNTDVSVAGAAGVTLELGALVGTTPTPAAQIVTVLEDANAGNMRFGTRSSGTVTERARITSGGAFKATNNGTYASSTATYHEFNMSIADENALRMYHRAASNPYGPYVEFNAADPNNATSYVFGAYTITGGAWMYRIYSNGTVAARSDAKHKKNIETARNGYLEDLAKLRIVKYNWYNHKEGEPKELGLIAQEVEQVFPGLVQTDEDKKDEIRSREIPAVLDEDGNEIEPARTEEYTERVGKGEYTKSIKFSVFTPMLIKAVQELKAINDAQATRIETLEAQNATFETRLAALEAN